MKKEREGECRAIRSWREFKIGYEAMEMEILNHEKPILRR